MTSSHLVTTSSSISLLSWTTSSQIVYIPIRPVLLRPICDYVRPSHDQSVSLYVWLASGRTKWPAYVFSFCLTISDRTPGETCHPWIVQSFLDLVMDNFVWLTIRSLVAQSCTSFIHTHREVQRYLFCYARRGNLISVTSIRMFYSIPESYIYNYSVTE